MAKMTGSARNNSDKMNKYIPQKIVFPSFFLRIIRKIVQYLLPLALKYEDKNRRPNIATVNKMAFSVAF